MRNAEIRQTEIEIAKRLMEIRDIMDARCPGYRMVNLSVSPECVSMFTSDNENVNYALPNMSIYDRRKEGENFCSYSDSTDMPSQYEDVNEIVAMCRPGPVDGGSQKTGPGLIGEWK